MALLTISYAGFSQDMQVCVGTKSLYKAVGEQGSSFAYNIPSAGKLLTENHDSILVQWGAARGTYQLGVQEISKSGCPGDWAYLDVAVVGAEIVFTQDPYMLCEGAVTVSFNNADFQTWQWLDNSIKKNTITNSGTYELQAFDWNGCLISKRISVLSPPKVNLGRDTMICTPGFRLHALKHNTNPEATVYTWSTGESGALPYLDVPDHATGQDVPYWVRADFGGCSVSDTVLVLACAQTYENPFQMMIPNTFTPNGDGDNDVWQIRALKDYPNVVVEVYDRWGRRVFIGAKGYPTPWDGRDMDGKTLPLETYYYIVNLNNGIQTKPILGTITIVR